MNFIPDLSLLNERSIEQELEKLCRDFQVLANEAARESIHKKDKMSRANYSLIWAGASVCAWHVAKGLLNLDIESKYSLYAVYSDKYVKLERRLRYLR